MHMVGKSDFTHEEKETIWKLLGFCTIITANGKNTTTEEASVQVRDLDLFSTLQVLETYQLYSRLDNYGKNMGISTNGRETITHINQRWNSYSLQVGNLCTNRRTQSYGQEKSLMQMQMFFRETQSKIFQTGFKPLTERLAEGGSGS